jgi:hypothetical protein
MTVARLSAVHTGHLYPQGETLVRLSFRGWVDPRHSAARRIKAMKHLKDPSGIEPTTFWLIA